MTPQEKLKEIKSHRKEALSVELDSWYEMQQDIPWLIARVEQLEERLHEIQALGFNEQTKMYQICDDALNIGPKPE